MQSFTHSFKHFYGVPTTALVLPEIPSSTSAYSLSAALDAEFAKGNKAGPLKELTVWLRVEDRRVKI